MARALQVTFDAQDPRRVSLFWRDVLGYVVPNPPGAAAAADLAPTDADPFAAWDAFLSRVGVPEDERTARSALEDPDGVGPRLFFQRVPETKTVKNRLHLDVRVAPELTGDARMAALEDECTRLTSLGGNRIRRVDPAPPMEAGFIVMADPEGNEFCLD